VTARDRTVLTVVAALALIAAAWFLLLAPVRSDVKAADTELTAAQTRLTAAEALVAQGATAKAASRDDYATISRLGKAVPADDDVPSLIVQIEGAADRSRVDFRSLELGTGGGAPATAPPIAQVAAVGAAEKGEAAPGGATGPTGPRAPRRPAPSRPPRPPRRRCRPAPPSGPRASRRCRSTSRSPAASSSSRASWSAWTASRSSTAIRSPSAAAC
jgi:hypothetical protein